MSTDTIKDTGWIIDLGATDHMTLINLSCVLQVKLTVHMYLMLMACLLQ